MAYFGPVSVIPCIVLICYKVPLIQAYMHVKGINQAYTIIVLVYVALLYPFQAVALVILSLCIKAYMTDCFFFFA